MKILSLALPLAALLAVAPSVAAPPAPKVSVASVAQLPQPLPLPYDEKANAQAEVAKARALAKKTHKRLLIDLGGNWCPDCRVLAAIMDLPDLKPFLAKHFVIVSVDIGRYDKNGFVADHYKIPVPHGAPALLAVDPRTDRLLNDGHLLALADARHMTPQALADWLAQWAA
jgi:thioredoxin-related protein